MFNSNQRTLLHIGAATLAAAGLSSCKEKTPEKPNIIYILADDLGYGDLGCYGQQLIETPNIDKLADNGVRFTQHYSGSPVSAPSRCVLLTGKHTGHAHIRGNDEWAERGEVWNYAKAIEDPNLEGQRPIPAGTPTIGTVLQAAGYTTGCVGKWGLGAPNTEGIPNKQGFDFFYGYNCQRQAHTFYPNHLWKNEEKHLLDNKLVAPHTKLQEGADIYNTASYVDFNLNEYSAELMQNEVMDFIDRNSDQPFFMYYANPIPHLPLQAPQEWVDYYVKKFGEEEPYTGDKGYFPTRYPRATYAAMISYMDWQVGQIVEKLKEEGIYENTLIIFTSDNGPTYHVGGADSPYFNSGGLFKCEYGWGKGFAREGGIRIPMIASWPNKIDGSSVSDHISAFQDVMPTFCEIADSEIPQGIDGISFLPELTGAEDQPEHEYLYWEFPAYKGQQAVRMGKWKAYRQHIFEGNMEVELYDLENDIQEQDDVANQFPEIVKKMEQIMKEAHTTAALDRFKIKQLGDVVD